MYATANRSQQPPSQTIRSGKQLPGVSLIEIIVALGLMGLLMTLSISLLTTNPTSKWNKAADDYALHVASFAHQYQLKNGQPLINATNTEGIAGVLPNWETASTYNSSTFTLTYPNQIQVNLHAETYGGGGTALQTALGCTWPSTSNQREWIIVDINGSAGPNSLACGGDQVALMVENTTGRIRTAKKWNNSCAASFYDVYKYSAACP
ncbi:MAG: hypothetical protein SFZ03_09040 [Candidatus Melainabacteria bacterium]|nr:hypothetical protein [Candidatus Melainabacteria bacterium]